MRLLKLQLKLLKNYKELENRLLENRNNPLYKIEQNGTTFYWLNEYFMPFVSVNKAAAEK
ncbi:hypothetical protein [Elizabethkingia meningoseptica]|uniref:hypothetical protein n=1 Tax=Elizabethkingia meningoseptica TaxID=238 RepID=UPI0030C7A189